MRKRALILLAVGIGMASAAPLLSQQSSSSSPGPQVSTAADQNETTVTGTVPPEPTGKHKLNSTLYGTRRTYRNLIDRAKKEKSIDILVEVPMPFFSTEASTRPGLSNFIRQLVCSSDAVVVGHVIGKESYLTENKDWVFTDYDFVVDEVFKSPDAQIEPGGQITVPRTGGELLIYGHPVKAAESVYGPFHLGDKYILFLKFLPTSESYEAVGEGGAYRVASERVEKLTRGSLIPELNQPLEWAAFENEVRIAATQTNTCESGKGGSK